MGSERWGIIVDDVPPQAETIARNLRLNGLPTKDFLDPDAALAFAREHRGSIVFAMFDVSLGERSGADYARQFRVEQLAAEIALMTAYEEKLSPAEREQLRELGVLIIPKPVDFEKLGSVLGKYTSVLQNAAKPSETAPDRPQPPAQEPPKKGLGKEQGNNKPDGRKRKLRRWIAVGAAAVVAVAVIAVSTVRIVARFQGGKVVVRDSQFVGENGKNKRVVVFVHGVMGDMQNTWVNSETQASWPQMIREDDRFRDFDVFEYGYASPALRKSSDIEEIATRFGQELQDRGIFRNYEEIDFITHSMGGIVTKRMLCMLNKPSAIGKLRKVHSVIYLSVPSNGADMAALASWISLNPQFKSMDPNTAAEILHSMENDWAELLRDRPENARFPRSFSAYETLPTDGFTVVPRLYTSQLSDGPIIAFDYNHVDIAKPRSRDSDIYRWVAARIMEASLLDSAADAHP